MLVDIYLHPSGSTLEPELNVIPPVCFRKRRPPYLRTDTNTLSAKNMEDAIVNRLARSGVGREMRIIEVR